MAEEKVVDKIHKLAVDLAKLECSLLEGLISDSQASWVLDHILHEVHAVNLQLVREGVAAGLLARLTKKRGRQGMDRDEIRPEYAYLAKRPLRESG